MTQASIHRCPYCFSEVPTGVRDVACPVKTDPDGSECANALPERQRTDQETVCDVHGVRLELHCWECRRQLPVLWDEVTTTCLVMAGTRNSGKTVYVGMAANLLLRWGRINGLTVTHYDADSRASFERRFGELDPATPLYAATVPETPGGRAAQQEPVLLRIQMANARKDHVLVLRDVAGEDVQNAAMDRQHFRFLPRSDGVILLVDPSDSRQVKNALADEVSLIGSDSDPAAVWGNLDALARAVNVKRRPPVAVTIAKFDLVLKAGSKGRSDLADALAGKGLRVHHDPSLQESVWNSVDADLLDAELRTLCSRYLDRHQLLERAKVNQADGVAVRFFAVSSLGHAPEMRQIASHGTPSYRCLDPIKWFLAQAGLIAAT